jgi:aminopeptidase N
MDTPSIKSTYTAKVITPYQFTSRMSANLTSETQVGNNRETSFKSTLPIPVYLIALVVGNIQYK